MQQSSEKISREQTTEASYQAVQAAGDATFTRRVQTIDQTALKRYLSAQREPCYESQLMRIAFPEFDIAQAGPLALYQHHFLLFHVLYRLQNDFYRENRYLHIHFMRTRLAPYPDAGFCRFFDDLLGAFCAAACADGGDYCEFHRERVGDSALDDLSLRYFYLDARNFDSLDERTATAFVNGTWELLAHYDDYRRSLKILDLPESADIAMIKKRFKTLAKQHHPDAGAASNDAFYDINNAYQLLLHLRATMQPLQEDGVSASAQS